MVLNGIGGRTLAEAKLNLTVQELRFWGAYRELRGSLHTGRRLQQELAQLHYSYLMVNGAKDVSIHDLMSYEPQPTDIEMLNALFGVVNKI